MKHTRTRTGCITCKRRRIKCDQGKPQCYHCTRRRLECRFPVPPNPSTPDIPSTPSPYRTTSGDPRIQYAFEDFVRLSLPEDQSSWPLRIPSTASPLPMLYSLRAAEPALDPLFAAICAVQRGAWSPMSNAPAHSRAEALFYHKAMAQGVRGLVARGANMQPEALFLGHEIMITAEVMRSGDLSAAATAMEKFSHVLDVWSHGQDGDAKMEFAKMVMPWYEAIRSVYQETARLVERRSDPAREPADLIQNQAGYIATSIEDLRNDLESLIFRWLVPLLRWNRRGWVKRLDMSVIRPLLKRWEKQFEQLTPESPRSAEYEMQLEELLLHHRAAIGVVEYRSRAPNRADQNAITWRSILQQYQQINTLRKSSAAANGYCFTSFGMIGPAFAAAMCCGDRELRQDAVSILSKLNINDGAWNSVVAYLIALAMQPVYEALEEQIALTNRLSSIDLPIVEANVATFRSKDEKSGELTVYCSLQFREKQPQYCSKSLDVIGRDFVKACGDVSWPLSETIRSLGYGPTGSMSSPYMATLASIEGRINASIGNRS